MRIDQVIAKGEAIKYARVPYRILIKVEDDDADKIR